MDALPRRDSARARRGRSGYPSRPPRVAGCWTTPRNPTTVSASGSGDTNWQLPTRCVMRRHLSWHPGGAITGEVLVSEVVGRREDQECCQHRHQRGLPGRWTLGGHTGLLPPQTPLIVTSGKWQGGAKRWTLDSRIDTLVRPQTSRHESVPRKRRTVVGPAGPFSGRTAWALYPGYGHYANRRDVPPRMFLLHPHDAAGPDAGNLA